MSGNRKFIAWIIVNGLFLSALYLALWWQIDWLSIVVIAFIWFVLVANAVAFSRRRVKHYSKPAPHWLGYMVDGLVLFPLMASGWYLTALAYCAGATLLFIVYFHPAKHNGTERLNAGNSQ